MKNKNKYISFFYVILFTAGFFSSAFHLHDSFTQHSGEIHTEITQDHNFCTLCAFHFETDIGRYGHPQYLSLPVSFYPVVTHHPETDPLINLQDSRAPPFQIS